MAETKIQLSTAEAELMCNATIILTKNKILETIKTLLHDLQEKKLQYTIENAGLLYTEHFQIPPKISKGENYLGLPYLIDDYPRVFKKEGIVAIRTMFWWGRFFSTTLHTSGTFNPVLLKKLEASLPALIENQCYIGINPDPWVHHFEKDNYQLLSMTNAATLFANQWGNEHIKLALHLPIENWKEAPETLFRQWKFFMRFCYR